MSKAKKSEFRPDDFVVYPAHGVGKIVSIEEQEVAGMSLEMFVISFEKDKMTLRVPTARATEIGMRSLASPDLVDQALATLKGKARVKRAMWSRRAQEYEQKINSGDLLAIAEVVRDLHRADDQREQSYSERQLYEAALERLTREVAAVKGGNEGDAPNQGVAQPLTRPSVQCGQDAPEGERDQHQRDRGNHRDGDPPIVGECEGGQDGPGQHPPGGRPALLEEPRRGRFHSAAEG